MSLHNINPLTFIGDQRNSTETPPHYAKHLVWALHHFEGTCSSTYSSINDHYTPFQMFPSFNVACTWQLTPPGWLECSPTTYLCFFCSFQTSAKTCEGLSILALSVTAVQRMSLFEWFMLWHKSARESSWEIQITGKASRLQMDDVEERSWIQYLVWIALAWDNAGKVFGDDFLHKVVLSKGVEGETLVWKLACWQHHTVLAVWLCEASWLWFELRVKGIIWVLRGYIHTQVIQFKSWVVANVPFRCIFLCETSLFEGLSSAMSTSHLMPWAIVIRWLLELLDCKSFSEPYGWCRKDYMAA